MPEMLKMISGHDHVIMVNQFPMYDSVLAKQIERGIRFYSDIDYVKQMRFGDIGIDVVRESDAFYGEEYELRDYRRVRRVVSQEMKLMGVNSKYKGYMYMECALSTELAYGTLSRGGAMKLYEHVGEQMGTSKHSTEKAIRTVIKDTWVNGNKKYFKDLWGYRNVTRDNIPNNKEFISIVVNSIERDYIL
jgi:two-component system response regulator (stage 0 sporulation protein A)